MTDPTTLAYLDAGTGAALAAVVASGAVGARAVLGSAKGKLRRKLAKASDADAPVGTAAPTVPSDEAS